MKTRLAFAIATHCCMLAVAAPVSAQDLGPGFTKVKDGIYVFAPDATTTTCSVAYKSVKK